MAPKTKQSSMAPKPPTPLAHNTLQVDFESVLSLDIPAVLSMFRTLEASGLRRFLGGATVMHEKAVREFFKNARMVGDSIQSTVNGSDVLVNENVFSLFFELPSEGLISFGDIPVEVITEMLPVFISNGLSPAVSGKKKTLKIEYRLLCDINAKSLTAKAGSFDSYTGERIEVMVAI